MTSALLVIGEQRGHGLPKQVLYQAELCPDTRGWQLYALVPHL